ncbi:plasma membrane calcium, partial [Coemansia furcata]
MDSRMADSERTPTAIPGIAASRSTSPLQHQPDAMSSESSILYTQKAPNLDTTLQVEGPDPDKLSTMVGDKDTNALRALGGTTGLLLGLCVDSDLGLAPAPHSTPTAAASFEPGEPNAISSKAEELARLLASEQGDEDLVWLADFEADRKVHAGRGDHYGINILPPAESRSFLGLVWDTLHDKMLILLIVAA